MGLLSSRYCLQPSGGSPTWAMSSRWSPFILWWLPLFPLLPCWLLVRPPPGPSPPPPSSSSSAIPTLTIYENMTELLIAGAVILMGHSGAKQGPILLGFGIQLALVLGTHEGHSPRFLALQGGRHPQSSVPEGTQLCGATGGRDVVNNNRQRNGGTPNLEDRMGESRGQCWVPEKALVVGTSKSRGSGLLGLRTFTWPCI